jgi:hypothetical protein
MSRRFAFFPFRTLAFPSLPDLFSLPPPCSATAFRRVVAGFVSVRARGMRMLLSSLAGLGPLIGRSGFRWVAEAALAGGVDFLRIMDATSDFLRSFVCFRSAVSDVVEPRRSRSASGRIKTRACSVPFAGARGVVLCLVIHLSPRSSRSWSLRLRLASTARGGVLTWSSSPAGGGPKSYALAAWTRMTDARNCCTVRRGAGGLVDVCRARLAEESGAGAGGRALLDGERGGAVGARAAVRRPCISSPSCPLSYSFSSGGWPSVRRTRWIDETERQSLTADSARVSKALVQLSSSLFTAVKLPYYVLCHGLTASLAMSCTASFSAAVIIERLERPAIRPRLGGVEGGLKLSFSASPSTVWPE